jgi:hypothetical protein
MEQSGQRSTCATNGATFVLICAAAVVLAACIQGCAPRPLESSGSAETDDSLATLLGDFTFATDAECAVCHDTEGASLADSACPASNHATFACTDCHSDIDGLVGAHEEVAYGDKVATRLKTTAVGNLSCLTAACHESSESLAEKTVSVTTLTDSRGTVVNPHAMPASEEHATILCGDCHRMHSSDDIADTAQQACLTCHHMGVYECYTCHD